MEVKINVGDSIGIILKFLDPQKYELREAKITEIRTTGSGVKVYAPKRFHPILIEEIESNTSWMKQNRNLILTIDPETLPLVKELRDRIEKVTAKRSRRIPIIP